MATITNAKPASNASTRFLLDLMIERNPKPMLDTMPDVWKASFNSLVSVVIQRNVEGKQDQPLNEYLMEKGLPTLAQKDCSKYIDRLKECPPKGQERKAKAPKVADTNVPAGHYAVPTPGGTNETTFYRVDRPDEGKWEGYVFVKQIVGPDEYPAKGNHRAEALARIEAHGITESMALYGQLIGKCGRCHRRLTNDLSRERGIGPECWGKL